MSEFTGINSVGSHAMAARPAPMLRKPDIPTAEQGSAGTQSKDFKQSGGSAYQNLSAKGKETVLTGPPPSFQASLLEVEADLQTSIRRAEASRERSRNQQAVSNEKQDDTRPKLDKELLADRANGNGGPAMPTDLMAERLGIRF